MSSPNPPSTRKLWLQRALLYPAVVIGVAVFVRWQDRPSVPAATTGGTDNAPASERVGEVAVPPRAAVSGTVPQHVIRAAPTAAPTAALAGGSVAPASTTARPAPTAP